MPNIFSDNVISSLQRNADDGKFKGLSANMDVRVGSVKGMIRVLLHGFHLNVVGTNLRILAPHAAEGSVPDYTIEFIIPSTIRLVSTSVNDTVAGTGGRYVFVTGLDINFNPITEVIVMNGTTPTTNSTQVFNAVNEMQVISAGTSHFNEGSIYCTDAVDTITSGVPDNTIYHGIHEEWSVSQTGIYTIRAGYTGMMTLYASTTNATVNNPNLTQGLIRAKDAVGGSNVDLNLANLYLDRGYGQFDLFNAPSIPEKSTFYITTSRVSGGGGGVNSGVYWHLNIVKNRIFTNIG